MKRRSKAGGALLKGRRGKASKPEGANPLKTAPRSKSSPSLEQADVGGLADDT
jgi:hypothetical protein